MNAKKSRSTILVKTTLVQFLLFSSVFGNAFETHYKSLLGSLVGQSLEDVFDGVSITELEHNAENFTETVDMIVERVGAVSMCVDWHDQV